MAGRIWQKEILKNQAIKKLVISDGKLQTPSRSIEYLRHLRFDDTIIFA